MKTILRLLSLFIIGSIVLASGCKKSSGGGGTTEANLVVTIDPPNGSNQTATNGPFNLKVTITSTMPPNGVRIEISAKKDDGTNPGPFFTSTTNSTTSVNDFVITNTPVASLILVTVTVTSLTKPTNVWTGSYRYSRK